MIIVDIIRPGSINAIIGPVGTLKRILNNQDYFNTRGYHVTVFTKESIQIGPILQPPTTLTEAAAKKHVLQKLRSKLGSFLRMKAKGNIYMAKFFLNKEAKKAETLVDYYLSLDRSPDIVQFHSEAECYYYLKNRKEVSAKVVMFLHSDGKPFEMELQYYPCLKNSNYLRTLQKEFDWTIGHVDRIVFIAQKGQNNFLQLYPQIPFAKTSLILNGINDFSDEQKIEYNRIKQNYLNSDFKYRLCCSGTINTRKGHRIIIEALHLLPPQIQKEIHVDFMGEGPERIELEKLVENYGLSDHIKFYGQVPNENIYKYLAKNNIYILMSKNEGLPISIIEAMRAGLPIISTQIAGIPELVEEGYNGCLVNPSVDELLGVLNNISGVNWEMMGYNSRIRFEKEFTFERMKKEICDMYDLVN